MNKDKWIKIYNLLKISFDDEDEIMDKNVISEIKDCKTDKFHNKKRKKKFPQIQ